MAKKFGIYWIHYVNNTVAHTKIRIAFSITIGVRKFLCIFLSYYYCVLLISLLYYLYLSRSFISRYSSSFILLYWNFCHFFLSFVMIRFRSEFLRGLPCLEKRCIVTWSWGILYTVNSRWEEGCETGCMVKWRVIVCVSLWYDEWRVRSRFTRWSIHY